MRLQIRLQSLMGAALIAGAVGLSGCASTGRRNTTETLVVTASTSLSDQDVKFVLELRDGRQQFTLGEADEFLASDRAANLSRRLRSQVGDRSEKLRRTRADALQGLSDGLAIVKPDRHQPYADSNLVVYIAGKTDIRVLFSFTEIARLLALREFADDLATIRYTHPDFDGTSLSGLRDRVTSLGLDVENLQISPHELEELKTAAAARILERELRAGGVALPVGPPLLVTETFAPTRSPKLTEAFKDQPVIERIIRSDDPNVIRALVYLVRRGVISLEYP